MRSDDDDQEYDLKQEVPVWMQPGWDEKVQAMFDEWDKWTPCDPPPELLEYRKFIDEDGYPIQPAPLTTDALVVDVATAMRMLCCGRTLIYELIRTHQLQAVKIGRLTRIPVSSLKALVERKLAEAAESSCAEAPEWWDRLVERDAG